MLKNRQILLDNMVNTNAEEVIDLTSTNCFSCAEINSLKLQAASIVETVKRKGFVKIRGLFERDLIREKLISLYNYANTNNHQPTSGVSPDQIRNNMSKWSIGGQSLSQSGLARFMLTIYNPLFRKDLFRLHAEFSQLIEIRDALAKRIVQTDDVLLPERFNGCRVQIYPAGGGFMAGHIDTRAVSNLAQNDDVYIQLVLLLTERGTDFDSGGAFVLRDDQIMDSEAGGQSGDVLVYDGATIHGVNDIDSEVAFNMNNLRGRAVALATIYNKA